MLSQSLWSLHRIWISRLDCREIEIRTRWKWSQYPVCFEAWELASWFMNTNTATQSGENYNNLVWVTIRREHSMLLSIIYQAETNYDDTILDFISFQSAFKWILPSRSHEVCFLPITNWTWTQKYWQFPCFFSFLPCGKPNRKSILISNNNLQP